MTRPTSARVVVPLVLLAAVAAVSIRPAVASAHAVLESTSPAAGSELRRPPTRIELTFGESVTIPTAAVRLFDSSGTRVGTGAPHHPRDGGDRVVASVPHLPDGTYVVAWKAISADSHPVNGAFTFSVGSASGDGSGLVTRYQQAGGSRVVGVVHGIVRFIGYGAAALLVGGVALLVLCWPSGAASGRARRWLRRAAAAGIAASIASIPLQAAYGEGDGFGQVVDPSLWSEVLTSRFGWAAVGRALAFGIGLVLVASLDRIGATWWRAAAAATAVVIAVSFAWAGHGATGRWPLAGAGLDTVHVLGFSTWLGGLVGLLAWVLRDADPTTSVRATRRFSSVALVSVAVVVLSGGAQGLRQIGWSWTAVSSTTYGRLLVAKVGLVLAVVVVAWVSRRHLGRLVGARHPDAGAERDQVRDGVDPRRDLRRTVALESVGLAAVLAISSILSVTIPAREAVELPFERLVRSGDATAQIWIIPARAGRNQVHVTVFGKAGSIPDLAEMDVELDLPSRHLGPIQVPMTEIASNHYYAESAVIPLTGDWRLTVKARVGDFDQDTFEVVVPVR